MQAYTIPDVRSFMKQLLSGTTFDTFQLRRAELDLLGRVEIDGRVVSDYLPPSVRESRTDVYLRWEEIRPKVAFLIKGGYTPARILLSLAIEPSKIPDSPSYDQVESYQLTFHFGRPQDLEDSDNLRVAEDSAAGQMRKLWVVSGVSYRTFVMDKAPERFWDEEAKRFLGQCGISLQEP